MKNQLLNVLVGKTDNQIATSAVYPTAYSPAWKADYIISKLGLIPAFGDTIGTAVNKAELSLCAKYAADVRDINSELVAALRDLLANAEEKAKYIDVIKGTEVFDDAGMQRAEQSPEMARARAAIAKATA